MPIERALVDRYGLGDLRFGVSQHAIDIVDGLGSGERLRVGIARRCSRLPADSPEGSHGHRRVARYSAEKTRYEPGTSGVLKTIVEP
jgi:hypothetical protein